MSYASELLRMLGMSGDSVDATVNAGWLKTVGRSQTVGGTSVRVMMRDNLGNVLLATGTTVPVDGGAGYAKGATFVKTNAVGGTSGTHINMGSPASALFRGVGDIRTVKVTVTNAQLKALRAAPKVLVAAPGANLCLKFITAVLVNNGGANALTETTDNLAIRYTDGTGALASEAIETTGFLDQVAKTMTTAEPKLDQIIATANSYNRALVLHNTGDGEYAGNAAADVTLDVWTTYQLVDVS
jgi:hypothetical protein